MSDKDLLKLIIDENHCSQTYLADLLGVSKQYINQVCNGKGNLSLRNKKLLKDNFPKYFNSPKLPTTLTAESLKKYRMENQYTQTRFANILEIGQSTLARIEDGNLKISKQVHDTFYKVFGDDSNYCKLYYCPEITIPNDFSLPETCEFIKFDKRLLPYDFIDYSKTYIVSITGDTLKPEYENNDKVLLDTSHTSFKDGYIYLIRVDNQFYVRRVNVSPNRVKCIPFNREQDAFVLEEKSYEIIGMIVPRIRL